MRNKFARFIAVNSMLAHRTGTLTIRVLLAGSSLLFSFALVLEPDTFTYNPNGFHLMAAIADEWVWAALFFLHFFVSAWRIYEDQSRPRWQFFANSLGFVLWFTSTACINVALGRFTPVNSAEWILVGFNGWVLYRTNRAPEIDRP